ncbi:hypothetical protein [Helicobacter felis]|uniref:Septum formation initiator n=1 Tax=Helicobacter felis (strain ATCC 49179 / CCUG 28539 / NCTC 12436 / CS1) TaxID=936155 RepID=E7AC97_HELFC|nr:hypothetical protein [Helicobacter felis]CBY82984.1 Putative hypothetical protein [Helicobacter felis ATCC 49179]
MFLTLWQLTYLYRYVLMGFAGLVLLGLYIGNLLFGDTSFEVLNTLKEKQASLQASAQNLRYENAKLQKQLFELKELEPRLSTP